ncbi:phosphate acyltransferase PlsX [Candidatus Aerophobetes bacterium]|uniref:Phosphate acyltransferase n=2 Tax=Aerophobetes bacterium TaxID=2030807 RepID=A0A523Y4V6_UNCAE|nr:MAG: phosphate acyltransferase PlsX [Candidatus Aerophobetes bacterium]
MRIALDAMGVEKGIGMVIEGAEKAVESNPQIEVILVGNKKRIEDELTRYGHKRMPFSIIHAPEVVDMTDSPSIAAKTKKGSSIAVALDLLKKEKAEALVSAGNTGAVMATSLLKLGKLKGVKRPSLAVIFPTLNGKRVIILDVGANVDCKPYHLLQFAFMGSIYAQKVLKKRRPRVGLLSIGEEDNKGNHLVIQTSKLLQESSLNFVGNIEGRDITGGAVEVVVCDGFVGNIILKFAEGFAKTTLTIIGKEMEKSLPEIGSVLSRRLFDQVKKDLDYAEYGGVPLLGIKGVCVIAHAASSSKAVKNAILASFEFANEKINQHIERVLDKG